MEIRRSLPSLASAFPRPRLSTRGRFAKSASLFCRSWREASTHANLLSQYERAAADGKFRYTNAQVPCLQKLDMLLTEFAANSTASSSSSAKSTASIPAAANGNPTTEAKSGAKPTKKGIEEKKGPPKVQGRRGLYIYGEPGTGKTMMMNMFHEAVQSQGLPSQRAHFHDFMLDVNKELHRIRQEVGGIRDPMALVAKNFVKKSPLLCFDECHVLNVGDALLMRCFFERLFEAGGTVVATSNLAPDQLYSSGINREVFQPFVDAILAHCDPFRLVVGEDFRSSKSAELAALSGARTFFWPLGEAASKQLAATISDVVGDAAEPIFGEIEVPMGRSLACRRMWIQGEVKAAEFSYEELCVRPVGTHDYIALSESFDVIILTDVPRFRSTEENAARRFASLVDVLYDRQKRLLCTIDAPPREIFAEIHEQYCDGALDDDAGLKASVRMPGCGGSSGQHVAQFRLPQAMRYTANGGYATTTADKSDDAYSGWPAEWIKQDDDWVEWSATGLKDASMWDLTCNTKSQRHDRLLPLIRCESRLEEMSYLGGS